METLIGLILINLIGTYIATICLNQRLDKIDQTLKDLRKHIEVTDTKDYEPMSNSAIAEKKWKQKELERRARIKDILKDRENKDD